jgi:hypothetical protein
MINDNQNLELMDIDGLTVKVTFELPFCLYLENGVYEVDRGGWAASLQLERVAQTHLDPRLGIAQATTELIRDRYGRLRFSKVVIQLPGKTVIKTGLRRQVAAGKLEARDGVVKATLTIEKLISDYGNVAFEEALNTVNRLIEVYRHVTNQFQIRRIPSEEIFKADIQWYQNDEPLGGTWYMGFGHGMTLEPQGIDAQAMESLRSWLSSTKSVPVAIELFQDARDRLDRAEYRLAIIDARTALEVFVDEVLLGYFSASGTLLEEACQVLDVEPRKVKTFEDALQRSLINRKVGHALKEALNLDLHDGNLQLWQRWSRAKELRERGAHRGEEVDRAEALEAVNTMGEILDHIRRALRSASWLQDSPEINQQNWTP